MNCNEANVKIGKYLLGSMTLSHARYYLESHGRFMEFDCYELLNQKKRDLYDAIEGLKREREHRFSITGICIDCHQQDERNSWVSKLINCLLGAA